MPPKRRATRSTKKSSIQEEEVKDQSQVEINEPKPKKPRGRKGDSTSDHDFQDSAFILETKKEKTERQLEPPQEISNSKIAKQSSISEKPSIQPLSSPSKRTSLEFSPVKKQNGTLSRLSSPDKRSSLELKDTDINYGRIEQSVHQAFSARNIPKLSTIIDDLKLSKTELLFSEYKNSAEIRSKASDDLITSLSTQNELLQNQLKLAQERINELENSRASTKLKDDDNNDEAFENELILDMIEQVVGLRIHKAEETESALVFDCSQSGQNGFLDYKLTIYKDDSSEIIYSPIENDDFETLKKSLPDYFFDSLTFPLETLQQFYHKIYRGLNK